MFEDFSDEARRAVVVAGDEARDLDHDHIGPEHLLLGLIRGKGDAAGALDTSGVSLPQARREVADVVSPGRAPAPGSLPFSDSALDVFEIAIGQAQRVGRERAGSGDMLLGLLVGGGSGARQVLAAAGVDLDQVRQTLQARAAGPPDTGATHR